MRATSGTWRALALTAGLGIVLGSSASALGDDKAATSAPATPPPTTATKPAPKAEAEPSAESKGQKIELNLVIAGLGKDGCEVEVKPGNRTVEFKPQTIRVPSNGHASVKLKDVELRGADRHCAFAVVVREKDHPAKTIYRGFRLPAESSSSRPDAVTSFTCFLSSASRIAELRNESQTRR